MDAQSVITQVARGGGGGDADCLQEPRRADTPTVPPPSAKGLYIHLLSPRARYGRTAVGETSATDRWERAMLFGFILWSRSCSYHRTKENFQHNISNYPLNSKSFHNHRYLSFHLKIINNQTTVKKNSFNKEDLSNYRPIANLSFISKLTEKRLFDHLTYRDYTTFPTFLMPSPCNKSPAFGFLIYELPLILSTTTSYSIVFPPGLAFPLFHYNGSLHISHPAYLL